MGLISPESMLRCAVPMHRGYSDPVRGICGTRTCGSVLQVILCGCNPRAGLRLPHCVPRLAEMLGLRHRVLMH